jgi:hypothetical protein
MWKLLLSLSLLFSPTFAKATCEISLAFEQVVKVVGDNTELQASVLQKALRYIAATEIFVSPQGPHDEAVLEKLRVLKLRMSEVSPFDQKLFILKEEIIDVEKRFKAKRLEAGIEAVNFFISTLREIEEEAGGGAE